LGQYLPVFHAKPIGIFHFYNTEISDDFTLK